MATDDAVFQVFQVFSNMLQAYVSSVLVVSDVSFKCFVRMCKSRSEMLHMLQWLYTYVASAFIKMLHMFHTYVASVLSERCVCLQWFSSVFRCFCKCFRYMFQVFHLSSFFMLQMLHPDVSKVDRVLQCPWEARGGASDVRGSTGLLLGRSLHEHHPTLAP
jgi:hypothetical protein